MIGWLWLIVGSILLFKVSVEAVLWKILSPALPGLSGQLGASPPPPIVRPLLQHMLAFQICKAAAWIAIAVCGWQLLRLRPWARVAIQAVCWLFLAYGVFFGVFWTLAWTQSGAMSPGTHPRVPGGGVGLAAGLVACALWVAALLTMIVRLRSPRVREVFRSGPAEGVAAVL